MRIGTKLLILLVSISVVPLLVSGGIRIYSSVELGRDLAKRQTGTLVEQAQTLMSVVAEDHAHTLQRERQLLEATLKFQAQATRARLLGPIPRDPDPVLFDTDIIQQSESLRLRKWRTPCTWLEPLTMGASANCVDKQVFHLAPGLTRDATHADVARLSDLDDVYKDVPADIDDLIAWQLTGLNNGLLSIYPGHGEFPPEYDIRQAVWYQKALRSEELVWADPVFDEKSGGVLFTVASPIRNEKGIVIAVSAIMAPLNVILQQNEHTKRLSKNMEVMFVTREASADGTAYLKVLAHRGPNDDTHVRNPTNSNVKFHPLATLDPEIEQLLLERTPSGTTSVVQASNRGISSLWTIAPVPGNSGVLIFAAPLPDILREVLSANQYLAKRLNEEIFQAALILGLTVILMSILSFFVSKRVTVPLRLLSEAAKQLSNGNFLASVDIRGKDEFAEVGSVFNEMGPHIISTLRIQEGVALAMQVQQNLLPRAVPKILGLDVAGASVYCDETGGDYYDFFLRKNNIKGKSLSVVVGDVSGHGMEAALLMTTGRAFLRMRAEMPGTPADIVTSVNLFICRDTEGTGRFMSLFYLEVDPSEQSLTWVRAGHDPALLYDPHADTFTELKGAGLILGADENWVFKETPLVGFNSGKIVALGSDGIWETRNIHDEMFGTKRFKHVIQDHAACRAEDILKAVQRSLDEFRGDRPFEDDVTLVIVKSDWT